MIARPPHRVSRYVFALGGFFSHTVVWLPTSFLVAGVLGVAVGSWRNLCADCPSIAQIATFEYQQTSKLFSHDGRLLTELGVERRTPISLEALPVHVPHAFLAIEDRRFYRHHGVDPRGIVRSVFRVVRNRSFAGGGGSTITQQLARNMFPEELGFEKRVLRKLKELQVALELEHSYSKDQILEAYINQVNYGHGARGIQTAARIIFGKDAVDLTVVEAALLAALPNAPSRYSPFRNPENALRRRNLVLDAMVREDFLAREEAERWKSRPLPEPGSGVANTTAPYFEEWVRQILDDRFGDQLYTAGLRVYTTLDVEMQRAAESAMANGWTAIEARPGFQHPKYEQFQDREEPLEELQTPYLQGAFIALDPWTGEVRAMIGGRDFRQSKFNRATQALRQAGSSFKPYVYAAALASRIPASHVLVDAPVVMEQVDGTEWKPRNYTGEFLGPMTIREGLKRSINMIAIQLGLEVGLESVAQTADRLGIRTEIERFPSTSIGAAEVIPLQMAEAYSGFATLGTKVTPHPILRVESPEGEVLWGPRYEGTRVLPAEEARIMVSMLQDVVNAGTAAGARPILGWDVPAAGKTGTTNDATDVWFIGFTPNLLATVWFGLDQPQKLFPGATGGGFAAPVWAEFMKHVYYGTEPAEEVVDREMEETDTEVGEEVGEAEGGTTAVGEVGFRPLLPIPPDWEIPAGLITRNVDRITGLLASRWCPAEDAYTELYLPGTEPTELCDRLGSSLYVTPRIRLP
jgi:penicillin-binding protein 1A